MGPTGPEGWMVGALHPARYRRSSGTPVLASMLEPQRKPLPLPLRADISGGDKIFPLPRTFLILPVLLPSAQIHPTTLALICPKHSMYPALPPSRICCGYRGAYKHQVSTREHLLKPKVSPSQTHSGVRSQRLTSVPCS